MVKGTKIKSKDDISWIKPETVKVKKSSGKMRAEKRKHVKIN